MPECRFTSTALGALRLAQENAARLGHSYVGSEHLLLGLLTQTDTLAGRILRSAGLQAETLRLMAAALWGR